MPHARNMRLNRIIARSFSVLWRLSILALPWQTRWIFRAGSIGGFPWEQGTVGLYGSQVILLLTIMVGAVLFRERWMFLLKGITPPFTKGGVIPPSILLFAIVSTATLSWTATGMWWLEVMLIAGFFTTLHLARVPLDRIAKWFVFSLVPHAALGIVQFLRQDAFGSAMLGMAAHHPWDQGVSVVEHGLYRVLRAYGGFPHPNIFGGWLAAVLAFLPFLVIRAKTKVGMIAYVFASVIFATALVFTFSRGAWIAALAGFAAALILAWKRSGEVLQRQAVALLGIMTMVMAGLWIFTQFDHVSARFTPEYRLERWSLETRSKAIADGIAAWRIRPVAGWGAGASLVGVSEVRKSDERWSSIAPEPPHAVPLVILVETGVLGAIAFVALLIAILHHLIVQKRWDALPLLAAGSVIAITDHYLWTLWPGIVLGAFIVLLLLRGVNETDHSKEIL
jgi:hypothetical protein